MEDDKKPHNPATPDPIHPYTNESHVGNENEGFVLLPGQNEIKFKHHPIQKALNWVKSLSKKQKIIYGSIVVVFLLAIGGSVYAMTRPSPPVIEPIVVEKVKKEVKKTTAPSKLTGVEIPIQTNKRPVTSIQIENSPDARPQSALIDAGVIFEAIAEGGITRFNASFLESKPDYIGPIRSARPYYVEMAAAFDPVFVHAGGSGEGLAKIAELGLKDIDHGPNAGAFQRIPERYAPHNLYSSTQALDDVIKTNNYKQGSVKGFKRKSQEKGKLIKANVINMELSSYLYNVSYQYEPKSNTYQRTMGGQPHTDLRSGKQLSPKVVVAVITDYSINGIYSVYRTSGSGEVYIFQDGQVQKGTWTKNSPKDQLVFKNKNKKVIPINKGQTWITMLGGSNQVSSTP